jgi:hypothetical protein
VRHPPERQKNTKAFVWVKKTRCTLAASVSRERQGEFFDRVKRGEGIFWTFVNERGSRLGLEEEDDDER